jgi:HemY protein
MRFLIWLVILSVGAVIAAWLMKFNTGHMVLFWNIHRIDLSLNMALILFVIFSGVFFVTLRLINELINLPLKAKAYRLRSRSMKASEDLAQAIDHLFAGRFTKAIKVAHFPSLFPETSNIALMIVAQANHQLKNATSRDEALEKIKESKHLQAKLILQAQFLVEDRQSSAALKIVKQLQEKGARQFLVQSVAMRAHQISKNWLEVIRLANNLKKRNYLSPLLADARMLEALNQLLNNKQYTSQDLVKQWQELSTIDQQNPALMRLFIKSFIQLNDAINAKKIFDFGFAIKVFPELVLLVPSYTKINGVLRNESILMIEKLLKQDMANYYLQFAMGELCYLQQLWGKAIASYETVISSPHVENDLKEQSHFRLFSIYEENENAQQSAVHQKTLIKLLSNKIHYE